MTGLGVTLGLALGSAAFGQETNPAASLPAIDQGNAPAQVAPANQAAPTPSAASAPLPAPPDDSKEHWRISEMVSQGRKDQPAFFGVRLAHAPQAVLAEVPKKSYEWGETIAVRLWGFNDLSKEFKGRVGLALKQDNGENVKSREETIRLTPATARSFGTYRFATEELKAGRYALETSLVDNQGKLIQQHVTPVTVRVNKDQEARRQAKADLSRRSALAKAEAKAKRDLELQAKADLSRRSALAKAEAEKQATEVAAAKQAAELKAREETQARQEAEKKAAEDLSRRSALAKAEAKAKAKVEEQARRDAELKAKADLSRRSALAKAEAEKQAAAVAAAKRAADQQAFAEAKVQCLAQEKSALEAKTKAEMGGLDRQETDLKASVVQAEADQKAAETKAEALAAESKAMKLEADQKEAAAARAQQAAQQDAPKDVKARSEAESKAAAAAAVVAVAAAKAKEKAAATAQRDVRARTKAIAEQQSELVRLGKKRAERQAEIETQAAENAECQARKILKAKQAADQKAAEAAKAKARAEQASREALAKADLSRRSALAKAEAKTKRDMELKAKAEAEKQAEEAEAAQEAAAIKAANEAQAREDLARRNALEQAEDEAQAKRDAKRKAELEAKVKLAAEKQAAAEAQAKAEIDGLVKQQTDLRAGVVQAEADQQAAEVKAAALVAEVKAMQVEADQKTAAVARAKRALKLGAPKDVQVRLEADARVAAEAKAKAAVAVKAKAVEAHAAQREVETKAKATAEKKSLLARVEKNLAERQAVSAAQAKQDAELKAREEARIKRLEDNAAARAARVQARAQAVSVLWPQGEVAAGTNQVTDKAVALAPKEKGEGKWRVAVGVLYRRIGVQRFKTGSYSAGAVIGAKSSDDHWVGPAGRVGDGSHNYDDGYVNRDDYSDLDGGTWNWGYNSGRQVNGNQIDFTGVDRVWREHSQHTTVVEGESSDSADNSGGLLVEAERYLAQTRYVDCGLKLGISRAQTFRASAGGMNTFENSQRWETYEDRVLDSYDITGTGITPDSPPYRGNRATEGPSISTTPMSRRGLGSDLVSAETYRAYNSISESLDMDLSTMSLGLSLKGKYRRVYVVGSTGPTLNLVEKDASYQETLYESSNGGSPRVLNYWEDSSNGDEYLFGYYVQGEVGVRIYHGLQVGVFGRYDWLENVSGNVGQSRYEVNPTGGSMGGTVGVQF